MCECNNQNKSVYLQRAKIHTIMAEYKVKQKYIGTATSLYSGYFVRWDNASQEELAHVYENINGGKSFVSKSDKTNYIDGKEKKKSVKKSNKKDITE